MSAPFSVEEIQNNIYADIESGIGREELESKSDYQICWGWRKFMPGPGREGFYDELHSVISENWPNTAGEFRFIFNAELSNANEALNPKGGDRPTTPPCIL